MIELIYTLFGKGDNLTVLQVSLRTLVVFLYTILLMRISGRRVFGLRAPFDNIVIVLLGATLGRAIVGASPFLSTLASGLVIAILHRIVSYLTLKPSLFSSLVKGRPILLIQDGMLLPKNLKRGLISQEDLLESLRIHAQTDDITQFKAVTIERNGRLGIIRK